MKNVIVVPTHITGIKFLENLLNSFRGYNKYPILIVICDYKEGNQEAYSKVLDKFKNLPISVEKLKINGFELGGLYSAYHNTDYDEFFLLSHSCEVINPIIFDMVFENHEGKSIAFGLQTSNWNSAVGENKENLEFILKYLDKNINEQLMKTSNIKFWQGHIGKYRRKILDLMNLDEYLPTNMIEAITKSEVMFTNSYHSLDKNTIELFPGWNDSGVFEDKFGKKKMKIGNEYIIKWKSHWSPKMVFDDMSKEFSYFNMKYKINNKRISFYNKLRRLKQKIS